MKTVKLHFKRHGSGDWLEIKELSGYYIEVYRRYWKWCLHVEKKDGDGFCILLHKDLCQFDYGIIQDEINSTVTDVQIDLERFIESYHIAQTEHPEDRDIINNIDVSGMTTAEVLSAADIKLHLYFISWNIAKIFHLLAKPNDKILNMKFKELYSLIHWNCHKTNFEYIFKSSTRN